MDQHQVAILSAAALVSLEQTGLMLAVTDAVLVVHWQKIVIANDTCQLFVQAEAAVAPTIAPSAHVAAQIAATDLAMQDKSADLHFAR